MALARRGSRSLGTRTAAVLQAAAPISPAAADRSAVGGGMTDPTVEPASATQMPQVYSQKGNGTNTHLHVEL